MARRKRGGQPGNRNAAGHRGANGFSAGRKVAAGSTSGGGAPAQSVKGTRVQTARDTGQKAVVATGDYAKKTAISSAYRAAARGVTVQKNIAGVNVRANVSFRPAVARESVERVTGGRIPSSGRARRTGRRT